MAQDLLLVGKIMIGYSYCNITDGCRVQKDLWQVAVYCCPILNIINRGWPDHQDRQKRVMGARIAQSLHRVKSAHSETQAQFEPGVFVGDLDGWGRSSCIVGRLFIGQRNPVAS